MALSNGYFFANKFKGKTFIAHALLNTPHESPVIDRCKTQSAKVLPRPFKNG